MSIKLVILDRDGVINVDGDPIIESPEDWQPLPGSLEAIARLTQAGYHIAVATNQSGIARNILSLETLHAIHQRMHEAVREAGGHIDVVVFCPHSDANECDCRKPMPGMLYTINERLGLDLTKVPVVGDSLRDVQAAMAANAKPVLVKTGKGKKTLEQHRLEHVPCYDDLQAFVEDYLSTPEPADSKGAATAS